MDIRLRNIVLLLVKKHFEPCNVGRKRIDPDLILDELLHILWSGSPWRALRSQSVSYQTVHRYFMQWRDKSIFKEAYTIAYRLQNRQLRRSKRFQCIDASFVKNVYGRDCVGRNPTDRGRMATKLSALVDQDGLPLSLVFFPANCNDMKTVKQTLTSKQCPCGTSELETIGISKNDDNFRTRRHTTYGPEGPCCVECTLGPENMDRDVLAIVNFLLCAKAALSGANRPKHLLRPWRALS